MRCCETTPRVLSPSILRPPILIAALLILLAGSAAAQNLTLWDGDRPIGTSLAVGTQLYVGLVGYTPGVAYAVELVDEVGAAIAQTSLDVDEVGRPAPTYLWQDVVPCRVTPDPLKLQFARYEEAELGLEGRELTLYLWADGQVISTQDISFDVNATVPRLFVASGDGRPCTVFSPGSPIYLGGYHLEKASRDLRAFFVRGQANWVAGDPLFEVRPEYATAPQEITLEPGEGSFLELAWTGLPGDTCGWDVVVQPGPDETPQYDWVDFLGEEVEHFCSHSGRGSHDPECMPCPPPSQAP